MVNDRQLIIHVLDECYPDETAFAEQEIVEGIIDEVKYDDTDTSSNISLVEIVAILTGAITTIKTLIDIYSLLKDKKEPTKVDIINEMNIRNPETSKAENIEKLAESVLRYYSDQDSKENRF